MQLMTFFTPGTVTDPIYRNTRDGLEDHHVRGREYLERIWQDAARYVDPDSAEKATRDFASVFWELQLAYAVKSAAKSLCHGIVWSTGTTRGLICLRKIQVCGLRQWLLGAGPARTPFSIQK